MFWTRTSREERRQKVLNELLDLDPGERRERRTGGSRRRRQGRRSRRRSHPRHQARCRAGHDALPEARGRSPTRLDGDRRGHSHLQQAGAAEGRPQDGSRRGSAKAGVCRPGSAKTGDRPHQAGVDRKTGCPRQAGAWSRRVRGCGDTKARSDAEDPRNCACDRRSTQSHGPQTCNVQTGRRQCRRDAETGQGPHGPTEGDDCAGAKACAGPQRGCCDAGDRREDEASDRGGSGHQARGARLRDHPHRGGSPEAREGRSVVDARGLEGSRRREGGRAREGSRRPSEQRRSGRAERAGRLGLATPANRSPGRRRRPHRGHPARDELAGHLLASTLTSAPTALGATRLIRPGRPPRP